MTEENRDKGSALAGASGTAGTESGRADAWANFQIQEEIASGGMGVIYRAIHLSMERPCAIKVLCRIDNSDTSVQRFMNEARLVCSLDHPNIVKVYAVGFNDKEQPYFAMEWLNGSSLDRVLETKGKLTIKEFRVVFSQVIEALAYAHNQGIIHRDLKPGNIFLLDGVSNTDPVTVKLLDFGIARSLEAQDSGELKLTGTGVILGTPAYMSPEQSRAQTPDQRSDIYSLGLIMYEAICGSRPFSGDTALDIMYKHCNEAVDPGKLPKLSSYKALNKCILKCLEKSPGERFQNADELLQEFKKGSRGLEDIPVGPKPFPTKQVLLAVTGVALLFFLAFVLSSNHAKKTLLTADHNELNDDIPANATSQQLMAHAEASLKKSVELIRAKKFQASKLRRDRARELFIQAAIVSRKKIAELLKLEPHKVKATKVESAGNSQKDAEADQREKSLNDEVNRLYNTECELGRILEAEGLYEQARKHLQSAIFVIRNNHQLRSRAAREAADLLVHQGKTADAIRELEELVKLPPDPGHPERQTVGDNSYYTDNSVNCMLLADLLSRSQRFLEAAEFYKKALEYNQKDSVGSPVRKAEVAIGLAQCTKSLKERRRQYEQAYKVIVNECRGNRESADLTLSGSSVNVKAPRNVDAESKACLDCALFFETVDKKLADEAYVCAFDFADSTTNPDVAADVIEKKCGFANDSGRFDDAAQLAIHAYSSFPPAVRDTFPIQAEAHFAAGVSTFLNGGRSEDVLKDFHESLSSTECFSNRNTKLRLCLMMGRCYKKLGDNAQALTYFDKAFKESGKTDFAQERKYLKAGLSDYVQSLEQSGRSTEAERYKTVL